MDIKVLEFSSFALFLDFDDSFFENLRHYLINPKLLTEEKFCDFEMVL